MSVINKKKISIILSQEGMVSLCRKAVKYGVGKIFNITTMIIFELELKNIHPKAATDLQLSLRLAGKTDIDVMDEEHYNYNSIDRQCSKDRLSKGDKCVLAVLDNKIVGYLWVMKDCMALSPNNYILLSQNRAYTYRGFVVEEYRGKRIHAAMYNYIVNMAKKDGNRFVISTVDRSNKPARKTKSKDRADYEEIGKIFRLRFLGLKYDYINKKTLNYLQSSYLS